MSSSTIDTATNSRNIRNATERLTDLEKAYGLLSGVVDKQLAGLASQLNTLSEVVNAITETVGMEAIQQVITAKALSRMDAEQKQIDEALASGRIAPAETINANSIISYEELEAGGAVRQPPKFFKNVSTLTPEAVELLKDKAVGFELDLGGGAKMRILEVWSIVEVAPPVPAAE